MPPHRQRAERFSYGGYIIDPTVGEVRCTYSTDGHSFEERYVFVRILFLLAGVSYYKATAARVVDLGTTPTSTHERAFLTRYYREGLGEFAFRNELDLSDLLIVGPDAAPDTGPGSAPGSRPLYVPDPGRPLIPFGGGIDSIVTVAGLAPGTDAALCIVHPPDDRFAAIEGAASVTGLPIVHIEREIDPLIRRSNELGFFNGHVPITAVITAAALVAAVRDRRDAVVLSNEWSASAPTLVHEGRPVNHQWSKSIDFEEDFADLAASCLGPELSVFSYLRSRSELWVARQFARLTEYHGVFRSCNRSFHQDPAQRLERWCGVCDKCCFIDLILSPYMSATELGLIFDGNEPLDNPALQGRFVTLLGLAPDAKPFECVGDVEECRAALLLAADRPDRRGTTTLDSLRARVRATAGSSGPGGAGLLTPRGDHHIPERYAPTDLLVRAH